MRKQALSLIYLDNTLNYFNKNSTPTQPTISGNPYTVSTKHATLGILFSDTEILHSSIQVGDDNMQYWLAKTEPDSFSYADLQRLGHDRWNGVRNFAALKHMKHMNKGDLVFIYHTGKEKSIVGVAEIVSTPYPDPSEQDNRYIVVDVEPRYPLTRPVTLKEIKANTAFQDWELVRLSRLSVMPVAKEHWELVHTLANDKLQGSLL